LHSDWEWAPYRRRQKEGCRCGGRSDPRIDEYTPYTTPSRTADTKHKTSRVIM
jgi:hypothetical protein